MPVRALRVTFVGELGWELYCPTEYGAGLWRSLWQAGREHGLVAGGYRAIDSLRLEKGYRVWAADITPDETPLRGGPRLLREEGRRVPRREALGGSGRLDARRAAERRLRCLVLEDPRSVALGNEPVRCGGEVRRARDQRRLRLHASNARSPTPTCRPRSSVGAAVEVDIFGEWVAGEVAREPLFDPKGERVRERLEGS